MSLPTAPGMPPATPAAPAQPRIPAAPGITPVAPNVPAQPSMLAAAGVPPVAAGIPQVDPTAPAQPGMPPATPGMPPVAPVVATTPAPQTETVPTAQPSMPTAPAQPTLSPAAIVPPVDASVPPVTAPVTAVTTTGNPGVDELVAIPMTAMKAKDKREYVARMQATLETWIPYAADPALTPEAKAEADVVLNVLRARIEEVENSRKRGAPKTAAPAEVAAQEAPVTSGGEVPTEEDGECRCGGTCGKRGVSSLSDVERNLTEAANFIMVNVGNGHAKDLSVASTKVFDALFAVRYVLRNGLEG